MYEGHCHCFDEQHSRTKISAYSPPRSSLSSVLAKDRENGCNRNHFLLIYLTSHSMPSCTPSCVFAEQAIIDHCLFYMASNFSVSEISSGDNAVAKSYLFAKINSGTLAKLFSPKRFSSSSPASFNLLLSDESMTYTSASVFS